MAKEKKSWEKRLSGEPDRLSIDFVESLSYDYRLYKYDIAGSIAHANMLIKAGFMTADEFGQIKTALEQIGAEISAGTFEFDKRLEDIHMAIEAGLVERIGDTGKKLHTGRSRNDQVATDLRLWMRDEIGELQGKITNLQRGFVELANKNCDSIMPAYTHLQRAQPVVIGSYLLSFVEQLQRDFVRLGNCRNLLNVSPLGSGAVAGSTLAIDRECTAKELGFDGFTRNSIDSVSDRDFCAEFIFDCSLGLAHLSRLAEDWIIYSTNEFGFINIDDRYCTSSSMMPQKKNPDMLELIRGKSGSVYGSLVAMLTILKAQPSGYNRDLQEDKIHVFSAADTFAACLEMAAAIVGNTEFKAEKIEAGIDSGYLDATALAEYLVGRGVAFRQAHGIVGGLVADCEKEGISLSKLSVEQFKKHCELIDDEVYNWLGADNVVGKYVTAGAGGRGQCREQIKYWVDCLAKR